MNPSVLRIAHLSDVHLLDTRPARSAWAQMSMRYLSLGRRLDVPGRLRRLRHALNAAIDSHADHVVISGDLTELGTPGQFETFAEVLVDAAIDPARVTLVPGNHDVYSAPDAWKCALAGPLRPFAGTAASEPGKVVERDDLALLPVDVACFQPVTRSAGEFTDESASAIERRLRDPALQQKSVVLVQHHSPFPYARGALQWFDGLRGHEKLLSLLTRWPNVQVLHGHLHRVIDRIVGAGDLRVFGAPATVEGAEGGAKVRLYDLRAGVLVAAGLA